MRWPMLSIRVTVLTAITVAVLAPNMILWHLEQKLTRQAQEPLIAQNRKVVLQMTANALVKPMWSLDEPGIQQVAQRVLDEPTVLSLRLIERRPLTAPTVLVQAEEAPFEGVPLKTHILHGVKSWVNWSSGSTRPRSTGCWPTGGGPPSSWLRCRCC